MARAVSVEWASYYSEMLSLNRTMVDKLASIDRQLAEMCSLLKRLLST
jgi:hypothetical protein